MAAKICKGSPIVIFFLMWALKPARLRPPSCLCPPLLLKTKTPLTKKQHLSKLKLKLKIAVLFPGSQFRISVNISGFFWANKTGFVTGSQAWSFFSAGPLQHRAVLRGAVVGSQDHVHQGEYGDDLERERESQAKV